MAKIFLEAANIDKSKVVPERGQAPIIMGVSVKCFFSIFLPELMISRLIVSCLNRFPISAAVSLLFFEIYLF